jgi:3-oxoacyl-[acyl-carrier-protein] synthase-3
MIIDINVYLPEGRLTNVQLSEALGKWNADEIFEKTGISCRTMAPPGVTALDMAEHACRPLVERNPAAVDTSFILFCTQFPDYNLPPNATLLQSRLGLSTAIGATDFSLACSGYVYGLFLANALLVSGQSRTVLLVTADTYTRHLAHSDSSCRPIFGDAATATLLSHKSPSRLHSFCLGTDGREAMLLSAPMTGERYLAQRELADRPRLFEEAAYISMNGPEVFNFTLKTVPSSIRTTLDQAGLEVSDIDYFVLHQANSFMLEHLRRRIGAKVERFIVDMSDTGNTVASTIPIILSRMKNDGRLATTRRILLCGFGVGLSWASCILNWEPHAES